MFTVSYSKSNQDESGSVGYGQATMSDVVVFLETSIGMKLTAEKMIHLLTGNVVSNGDFDVWLIEDVFNGNLN